MNLFSGSPTSETDHFGRFRPIRRMSGLGASGKCWLAVDGDTAGVIQVLKLTGSHAVAFIKLASIRIWLRADESTP
jgi:hypothetical protein